MARSGRYIKRRSPCFGRLKLPFICLFEYLKPTLKKLALYGIRCRVVSKQVLLFAQAGYLNWSQSRFEHGSEDKGRNYSTLIHHISG